MKSSSGRPETPGRAVLVRRQHVDIADVSRSGCRLEGAQPMPVGAVGMLSVEIEGESHVELFRVCRAGAASPDGRYESGVEFLPLPAGAPSIHELAAQLDHTFGR